MAARTPRPPLTPDQQDSLLATVRAAGRESRGIRFGASAVTPPAAT
jgi:hypothetical protein